MYRLSYYPWLTQNVAPEVIDREIRRFAAIIEGELEQRGHRAPQVEVLPPVDVPQQITQVVDQQADIALMNPLGLVVAERRSDSVSAVAVALRLIDGKVGREYFSQLYAHERTGVRTLADAVGRSIAYGVPYSTSNFLIPAFMLLQAGVHPLLAFSRIEFLLGHELIARAVYEGKVDMGAGHDGVITDLSRQPGYADAATALVQIARSDPLASDPVVVNVRDEAERALVRDSIVAAGNTDAGKETLKIFWGNAQGLEPTDSAAYDGLRDALTHLKLDETDLFGRQLS